jgi:hypothetical protein
MAISLSAATTWACAARRERSGRAGRVPDVCVASEDLQTVRFTSVRCTGEHDVIRRNPIVKRSAPLREAGAREGDRRTRNRDADRREPLRGSTKRPETRSTRMNAPPSQKR